MKRQWKHITAPFTEEVVQGLREGDLVLISGTFYTARDKAHERLCAMIKNGEKLPFEPEGNVLYYVGPAVYLSSFGGAGAYLAKRILSSEVVAFDDLGPEAVYRIEVLDFPAVVINDMYGGDLYETAIRDR